MLFTISVLMGYHLDMNFLSRNKNVIAIIIGAIIIAGGMIYSDIRSVSSVPTNFEGAKQEQTEKTLPNEAVITKVIDGDTVVAEGGKTIRLLGIDTDERGKKCFLEAKQRLEDLVLGEKVRLERGKENKGKYDRFLRFLFAHGENVSRNLVREGYAVARFMPGQHTYRDEITSAEEKALNNEVGCKWGGENTIKENPDIDIGKVSFNKLTQSGTDLEIIKPCSADSYMGKEMIVEGVPSGTYHDRSSDTVFINFGEPYPNHCFTAVIFSSNLQYFPETVTDYYRNKALRIRGKIKKYKGKPEIVLEKPSQVEVGK